MRLNTTGATRNRDISAPKRAATSTALRTEVKIRKIIDNEAETLDISRSQCASMIISAILERNIADGRIDFSDITADEAAGRSSMFSVVLPPNIVTEIEHIGAIHSLSKSLICHTCLQYFAKHRTDFSATVTTITYTLNGEMEIDT